MYKSLFQFKPAKRTSMNWYIAKLVFQVISGEGVHKPQFDEQLRLVCSPDSQNALDKAQLLGINLRDSFLNTRGELVRWRFIAVAELRPVDGFKDEAAVYSSTHETDEEIEYIRNVEQRNYFLRTEIALETALQSY